MEEIILDDIGGTETGTGKILPHKEEDGDLTL